MTKDVTFEQMSASLGSLLLLWAAIERAVRKEAATLYGGCLPKSAYGLAGALNAWRAVVVEEQPTAPLRALLASTLRDQLQERLKTRNGVCHGLVGVSSAYAGKPASLMWEINDVKCSITWEELQAALGWLSKVPFAISIISNSPTKAVGSRLTDNLENRDWWRAEYGLDLPELSLGADQPQD